MADSYKMRVPLADIVPGANPRKDFGDIDELAAAIEATGGQPVNPPVVVADGGKFRLVDGERRVRALRKLHGDGGQADVLMFPSYDEAEEAVAMVATDAKRTLTEAERARGFQRMLLLGVEERTVAKAIRRKVEDVRKAARVAAIAPEQTTLDQMIAAAEFDDEDEQRAVLEAGVQWAMKAQSIRRDHERREKNAPIEAELARLGVPVVEDVSRDGYVYGKWCASVEALDEWAEGVDLDGAVAERYQLGTGFRVYLPKVERAEPEPSPEVLARQERERRIESADRELAEYLLCEVATTDVMPHMAAAAGAMRAKLADSCDWLRGRLVAELGVAESLADELVMACPASTFELATWIADNYLSWDDFVMTFLPPAIEDGYQPSEEDEWLLEQAVALQAERDAEGDAR